MKECSARYMFSLAFLMVILATTLDAGAEQCYCLERLQVNGIKLGDSWQTVVELYGKPTSEGKWCPDGRIGVFHHNDPYLEVWFLRDNVVSIGYGFEIRTEDGGLVKRGDARARVVSIIGEPSEVIFSQGRMLSILYETSDTSLQVVLEDDKAVCFILQRKHLVEVLRQLLSP